MRESTLRQYMYYVPRLAGLRLCRKDDVSRVFKRIELNKSSYEAFSRFLKFLEKTRELDELVVRLRKGMPKKPVAKTDNVYPAGLSNPELEGQNQGVRTSLHTNIRCSSKLSM